MSQSTQVNSEGLYPAPPKPQGLPPIEITQKSHQVLSRRYLRKGKDGQPQETIEEMFWRVAYHVAKVEEAWDQEVESRAKAFYQILISKKFFPNSPTFTGLPWDSWLLVLFYQSLMIWAERNPGFYNSAQCRLIQQTGGEWV